jgi:hypothetical protein
MLSTSGKRLFINQCLIEAGLAPLPEMTEYQINRVIDENPQYVEYLATYVEPAIINEVEEVVFDVEEGQPVIARKVKKVK